MRDQPFEKKNRKGLFILCCVKTINILVFGECLLHIAPPHAFAFMFIWTTIAMAHHVELAAGGVLQ